MTDALEWVRVHARHRRSLGAAELRRAMARQRGQCTWCGGLVPKGRRTWCGDECLKEFRLACDPTFVLARIVRWRNGGRWRVLRCEACGLDVLARHNAIEWLRRRAAAERELHYGRGSWNRNRVGRRRRRRADLLQRIWLYHRVQVRAVAHDQWELDHAIPVCEGGGCCGPENLRVLCRACHTAATRELARRRRGATV